MSSPTTYIADVEGRIERFLLGEDRCQRDIVEFMNRCSKAGSAAIFGGMTRDLAIAPAEDFNSDIDVVIDSSTRALLRAVPSLHSAEKNAYGGFRLTTDAWTFDVWTLESTWAIRQNHVAGTSLHDLLETTFFSCDSIIYEWTTQRVLASAGFSCFLNHDLVDLVLQPNPNPIGSLVRTLRHLAKHRTLSPALASCVVDAMRRYQTPTILNKQLSGFGTHKLSTDFLNLVEEALNGWAEGQPLALTNSN